MPDRDCEKKLTSQKMCLLYIYVSSLPEFKVKIFARNWGKIIDPKRWGFFSLWCKNSRWTLKKWDDFFNAKTVNLYHDNNIFWSPRRPFIRNGTWPDPCILLIRSKKRPTRLLLRYYLTLPDEVFLDPEWKKLNNYVTFELDLWPQIPQAPDKTSKDKSIIWHFAYYDILPT